MKDSGFTLIELLTVIVVLGIVVAISLPGINKILESSEKKAFITEAKYLIEQTSDKFLLNEIKKPEEPNSASIVSVSLLTNSNKKLKSSYHNEWDESKSYVLIKNAGTVNKPRYEFYIALYDTKQNGIPLTKESNLKPELVTKNPNVAPIGTNSLIGSMKGFKNNVSVSTFNPVPNVSIAYIHIFEELSTIIFGDPTDESCFSYTTPSQLTPTGSWYTAGNYNQAYTLGQIEGAYIHYYNCASFTIPMSNSNKNPKVVRLGATQMSAMYNTKPVIPDTLGGYPVVGLLERSFYARDLTEVSIPASVRYIGPRTFDNSYLTTVKLQGACNRFDSLFGTTIFNNLDISSKQC